MGCSRIFFNLSLLILMTFGKCLAIAGEISELQPLPAWVQSDPNYQAVGVSHAKMRPITKNHSVLRDHRAKDAPAENPFSLSLKVIRSVSLYDLDERDNTNDLDYGLRVGYDFSFGTISASVLYSQSNVNGEKQDFSFADSKISYSHHSKVIFENPRSVKVSWYPSTTLLLPTSKTSREDELQSTLSAGADLDIDAGHFTSLRGMSLSLGLNYGQNFYRFKSDKEGVSLTKAFSRQTVSVDYEVGDWGFSVSGSNRYRWPYAGEMKQSFEFSEDIGYSISSNWTVVVGHTNSGDAINPETQESNVALISENDSVIYFKLKYSL